MPVGAADLRGNPVEGHLLYRIPPQGCSPPKTGLWINPALSNVPFENGSRVFEPAVFPYIDVGMIGHDALFVGRIYLG